MKRKRKRKRGGRRRGGRGRGRERGGEEEGRGENHLDQSTVFFVGLCVCMCLCSFCACVCVHACICVLITLHTRTRTSSFLFVLFFLFFFSVCVCIHIPLLTRSLICSLTRHLLICTHPGIKEDSHKSLSHLLHDPHEFCFFLSRGFPPLLEQLQLLIAPRNYYYCAYFLCII